MAETIWIVQGERGTHEDWECWTVCAFRNESEAHEFVKVLDEGLRAFKQKWPSSKYHYRGQEKEQMLADLEKTLDPHGFGNLLWPEYTFYKTELR